ncbi:hypothetical protein CYMTET_26815 [Cymbomonas tetramitiformis]|uniref:Uncharacterized protein n=1 Tax=Cymbomonas tetramitiformis TaxID=36881 RepID=A0AAE0FRP7_9CHLO|nr:hypothetical protein CYMTET_26815 [Cymbomonas tetramitiformis]
MFSLVMERMNNQEQDSGAWTSESCPLQSPEPHANHASQRPVDRMICKRMLEMAIKECTWGPKATKQNLETWRNITFDGKKLSIPDPQKFDVPVNGFLEFDYVSQKRAPSVAKPIRPTDMLKLLFEVETRQVAYSRKVESVQQKQRSAILFQQEQAKQAALRSLENTTSASRDAASKSPPRGKKGKKAKKKGPEVIPETHEVEQDEQDFIMPLVIQKDKEKFIENMAKKMTGLGDSTQLWIHSAVTYLRIHYASTFFFRCRQLIEILKRMDHGEQRVETMCMFYARVVDFSEFGEVIKILNKDDQIEVQQRLGWWNLYNEKSLDGLYYKLSVHLQEDMRVLSRICRVAHAHQQAMSKRLEAGLKLKKSDVVHIITDMSINGHSVHVPEDDHMFATITALANIRNQEGYIEFSIRLTKGSRDVATNENLTKRFSEMRVND